MEIILLGNRTLDEVLNVEDGDLKYVLPNVFQGLEYPEALVNGLKGLNGHANGDLNGSSNSSAKGFLTNGVLQKLSRMDQKRLRNFFRIRRILKTSGHEFDVTCRYESFINALDKYDPDIVLIYKIVDWKRYFIDLDYQEKVRKVYGNVLESHLGLLMPEANEIIKAKEKAPKIVILEPDLSKNASDQYVMHRSMREVQIINRVRKKFPDWVYSKDKKIENVVMSLEHFMHT